MTIREQLKARGFTDEYIDIMPPKEVESTLLEEVPLEKDSSDPVS
jgi:hypothetical protein